VRRSFQHGHFRLEILEKNESVLKFQNPEEVLEFLKRLRDDPGAIRIFRKLLSANDSDPEDKILSEMALLLANGKCRLLRTSLPLSRKGEESEAESKTGKSETPRKTSWIEINLKYPDGKPVPHEKYRLKLPDGSTQEGILDAYGHVEYYNINAGTCQVSFPDRDSDSWERT
jgi:hypothetical protein